MPKKLETESVESELKRSAFFSKSPSSSTSPLKPSLKTKKKRGKSRSGGAAVNKRGKDIKLSSYRDITDLKVEKIRKCVKVLGKEPTFLRLTLKEKRELSDIVYSYKRKGFKTSDNEVLRIALQFLMADFRKNTKQNILNKVLKALKA